MTNKIFILHDNESWLNPIIKSLEKYQLSYQSIMLNEGNIDVTKVPEEGVYFNRVSPSAYTRNRPHALSHSFALLHWLNNYDRKIVNNISTLELEVSKIAQYSALHKAGILFPKTIATFGIEEIKQNAKNFSPPFILKPNCGGKGAGVELFRSYAELENYLENNKAMLDGINLIQEYIKPRDHHIIRAEFINKEFIYAVRIDTEQGFDLCPADSCNIDNIKSKIDVCPTSGADNKFEIIPNFNHEILEYYRKFIIANNYDIVGIEFIIAENGAVYTYDVNANTNYNSNAEERAGISANDKLALFLKEELEKIGDNHSKASI